MEFTFLSSRARTTKREASNKDSLSVKDWKTKPEDAASQAKIDDTLVMFRPTTADTSKQAVKQGEQAHALMGTMAFQPRDIAALSQLKVITKADTSFPVRVEETPAEFTHLYAGLERIVGRVGSMSTVSGKLMETERPYVLGVTSAVSGEGKTTTALHLAMTIARNTPSRVCLVDLGLSEGGITAHLGMPPAEGGLVTAVEDDVDADTIPCFNVSGCENLTVVPAGRVPRNPAKFVRMTGIMQFLIATRHAFDVVIVDMPAVTTENAVPLARLMDGVVVVVRAGVTPRDVVTEALETLGTDRVNCVILNRAKPAAPKWLQKRYGRV